MTLLSLVVRSDLLRLEQHKHSSPILPKKTVIQALLYPVMDPIWHTYSPTITKAVDGNTIKLSYMIAVEPLVVF
jgi:hypothetical protein